MLRLICDCNHIDEDTYAALQNLISETQELVKIFVTMIRKRSEQ